MTGKCLKKHYGACRFRDQNDDCLWTFDGCHFHSAESPRAGKEVDVTLNDVLVELNACETIETSYKHLAGGHGKPIKTHLAITGPQELLDRLHNAIIRGRGKRN